MQGLYEFVRFDIKSFLGGKVLRSVSCGPLTDYQSKEVIGTRVGVVITEDIITALQAQGWQVERSVDGADEIGYEGGEVDNDWREGVFAYLRGMNGERIVIRVSPAGDHRDNDIAFHRIDNRSITSQEFMRSLRTLKMQIEKSGHKLGDIQAPKGDGGEVRLSEITSSSNLGKKGAAQSIRRKMRGY